ncbi:hypothetical protein FJ970_16255 [Mesorhizobium sp. B2-1-8]|nr:hypothetical protein [Mesorhizobium sp. B2-1-8]UCI16730.1 hypothetical protein FJ970_16255 [Mesorhizobium sp. B2-1-8]
MKMRPPVDFDLTLIQSVTPYAQARRRKMQRRGIFANTHAAPVHRLDMHRPVRLDSTVAHIRGHRKAQPSALFLPLRSLFQALLTAQFRLIFRMLTSRLVAREVLQPTIERVLRQAMHAAILGPRHTAALPRLDVNHPPGLPRLVLEMSQIHRRSSMLRRSPTYGANALLNLGAGTGRLPTTEGWQDKRAHIVLRSVDWICCFFCHFQHIAALQRNVRAARNPLYSLCLWQCVGGRRVR